MKVGTHNVRIPPSLLCADSYHTSSASHLRRKRLTVAVKESEKLCLMALGPPAPTPATWYPSLTGNDSTVVKNCVSCESD